jgi:hypothetical protein
MIGIIFFLLGVPGPAEAHHIRGLPHYGYTENYPQVPVNEMTLSQNGYTMNLTTYYFEGLKKEVSLTPDAVQIYLHLRDETTGRAYTGPIGLEIRNKNEILYSVERDAPVEESFYRFRTEIPAGRYRLAVKLPDRSLETNVDLGAPSDSRLKIFLLAGSAGAILFLAGFRKRLRQRVRARRSARVSAGQTAG